MPPSSKLKSIFQRYGEALHNLDNVDLHASSPRKSGSSNKAVAVQQPRASAKAASSSTAHDDPLLLFPLDDDKTVKMGNLSREKQFEHEVELARAMSLSLQENGIENPQAVEKEAAPQQHSRKMPTMPTLLQEENCTLDSVDQQLLDYTREVVAPPLPKRQKIEQAPDDIAFHNLPFGYFMGHQQLYRNQLNNSELLENGHVSLRNVVPPECRLALITTFDTPDLTWMESVLEQIPQVILVAHSLPGNTSFQSDKVKQDHGDEGDSLQGAVIGVCQAQPLPNRPDWYWIAVRPHVGLMHAKILLFRCPKGLRIVVSGNNFTQHQSSRDRDCMYIQDLPKVDEKGTPTFDGSTNTSNGNMELARLRSFVEDLTSSPHHASWMKEKLDHLFNNISPKALGGKVRFVYSFPRPTVADGTREDRGGWQQLAHAVSCFRKEVGHSTSYQTMDKQKRELEELHVYAMSGSVGDLKPDFLLQMRHAMSGKLIVPTTTVEWTDIRRTYVLWPSLETASTMHPLSMLGSGRTMGQDHWESIPLESRQRIFHDALPCPSAKALRKYHAFAHCKVILAEQENAWGAIYVGSHNFSKTAWGLKNSMPKNVEFGVVLFTQDNHVLDEWRSKLPYQLPPKDSMSASDYDLGRGRISSLPPALKKVFMVSNSNQILDS